MRAVVIGTGPAGITAAETLRHLDPAGSVVALTSEPFAPYSPPAMADHFLTGRESTLYWKGPDVAARLGIDERRGAAVDSIDTDSHEVVLGSGDRIAYDAVVIASGSRLHAPIEGATLPGVLDFKSLRTAARIVGEVRRGAVGAALIVGAGFIGVELSLLLAELGVEVTVLEREAWVMPRVLDSDTAEVVGSALAARGVTVRLGSAVDALLGTGSVSGVRLASGETLTADLYVAATGVKPHVEFLAGGAVAASWGVHVDDRLRTSVAGVYAAGDVAEAADWLTGQRYVHATFPNAVAQGRVAGANAAGLDLVYAGAESTNSLKHLGVPVVAIGTMQGADDVLRRRDGTSLCAVYLRGGRIIGAQLAGDLHAAGLYRSLMLRRADVTRFGRRLVERRFSTADVVWDAVRPGLPGGGSLVAAGWA